MYLLAAITVIGAWLGFANPVVHLPFAALCLPGGLALAGFRSPSARKALRNGFVIGLAAATACLYWLYIPVHYYGGLPWSLAIPCPLAVGAVWACYFAVFAWAMHLALWRLPAWAVGLAALFVWAGLENLAGFLLSGFPWLTLSSAFAPWTAVAAGAAAIGAYQLSGVLAALAVCLVLAVRSHGAKVGAVAALGLIVLGNLFPLSAPPGGPPLRVGMVQGNIDQSLKWDDSFQNGTMERYITLSAPLVEAGVDLLVWPETALPFYFQDPTPLNKRLREFVRDSGVPLVTGSPGYDRTAPGEYALYNRAFLVHADGRVAQAYDKEHLVPFGEYVPFGDFLPIDKLTAGVGDFSSGDNKEPLRVGKIALGMLICYEAIFPELAQKRVAEGANLLVNISNDAWFGRSAAPLQHLYLSAMRAVEQGRYVVRATNTGITAIIHPSGRIAAATGLFRTAVMDGRVRLITATTAFHRAKSAIAALVWIGCAAFAALMIGRPKTSKDV